MPRPKKYRGGFKKKPKSTESASTSSAKTQRAEEQTETSTVNTGSQSVFKKPAPRPRTATSSVSSRDTSSSSASTSVSSRAPVEGLPQQVEQIDVGQWLVSGQYNTDTNEGGQRGRGRGRGRGRSKKTDKRPQSWRSRTPSSSVSESSLPPPDVSSVAEEGQEQAESGQSNDTIQGGQRGRGRGRGRPRKADSRPPSMLSQTQSAGISEPSLPPQDVSAADEGQERAESSQNNDTIQGGRKKGGRPKKSVKNPSWFRPKSQNSSVTQPSLPPSNVPVPDAPQERGAPTERPAPPRELPTDMAGLARLANTMFMQRVAAELARRLAMSQEDAPNAQPEVVPQEPTQPRRSRRIASRSSASSTRSDATRVDPVPDHQESEGNRKKPRGRSAPAAARTTSASRVRGTRERSQLDDVQLDDDEHPDPAEVVRDPARRRTSRRISSRLSAASSVNTSDTSLGGDGDAGPIVAADVQVVQAPGGPDGPGGPGGPGDSGGDDDNGGPADAADGSVGDAASPVLTPEDQQDVNFEPPEWVRRQVGLPIPRAPTVPIVIQQGDNDHDYHPDPRRPAQPPRGLRGERDIRNYNRAVREGTYNAARGPLPDYVQRFPLGTFGGDPDNDGGIYRCRHCQAWFFPAELTPADIARGVYTCCSRGKIPILPADDYPEELEFVLRDNKKHVRTINLLIAPAQFEAKRVQFPTTPGRRAPNIYKIHGQTHAYLPPLEPRPPANAAGTAAGGRPGVQQRRNCQLIGFVTPQRVAEQVVGGLARQKPPEEVVATIIEYMEENNPYFKMFSLAHMYIDDELRNNGTVGEVTIVFKNPNRDKVSLRHNTHALPAVENEVAALFAAGAEPDGMNTFVVKDGQRVRLRPTDPNRDALVYPLMYPKGVVGWHPNIQHVGPNVTATRNRVTMNEFYKFKIYRRRPLQVELNCGSLTQQFIIDQWVRINQNRLDFIQYGMDQELMVASRRDLVDYMDKVAEDMNYEVGRCVVLPRSYQYGDEAMRTLFQHAIASIKRTGVPTFFVTMTANPRELEFDNIQGFDANDGSLHSDVVCRAFWAKVLKLKKLLLEEQVMGHVTNYILVTEFQKRGLPHIHLILTTSTPLVNPADVDAYVSTTIPDERQDPELHANVKRYMLHRCTYLCAGGRGGVCKKGFPAPFRDETVLNDGRGFVQLRRLEDGRKIRVGANEFTNQHVVPFNPLLLKTMRCHINVVPFVNMKQVRYIVKYVTKGPDMAVIEQTARTTGHRIRNTNRLTRRDRMALSMEVRNYISGGAPNDDAQEPDEDEPVNGILCVNEIKRTLDCTYTTSTEATWRTLQLPMKDMMFTVYDLKVHTEEETPVFWRARGHEAIVEAATAPLKKTRFLGYMDLCRNAVDPEELALLQRIKFVELPQHYVWQNKDRVWTRRKKGGEKIIGVIASVSPKTIQRYWLRAIVQHRAFITSFQDARTVDGDEYATFREAAVALGLARNDLEHLNCLREAVATEATPFAMRILFLLMLLHAAPASPAQLFDQVWESLVGEFHLRRDPEGSRLRVLRYLARKMLLNNAPLDEELFAEIDIDELRATIDEDMTVDEAVDDDVIPDGAEVQAQYDSLNAQQQDVVDTIIEAVLDYSSPDHLDQCRLFFMEGPAGTGKTHTYKVIVQKLALMGLSSINMAFTGVAAALLDHGRTLHSALGLPIPLTRDSESRLQPQSSNYKLVQAASLAIIDEVTMASVNAYKAADRLFTRAKDPESTSPFGGCPVLFGGDLRQLCPIPNQNETVDEIHFRNSELLAQCQVLHLTENMRANEDERDFAQLLKTIGEGSHQCPPELPEGSFVVPEEWILPNNNLDQLIHWTFGDEPSVEGVDCAILTAKNDDCRKINNRILAKMAGPEEVSVLLSEDSVVDDDPNNPLVDNGAAQPEDRRLIQMEELHILNPPGLPYHDLNIRVGAIAIIIRNLDVASGIVNGTRVRVENFTRNRVKVTVLSGADRIRGRVIELPRIEFVGDVSPLVKMRRIQFPLKIAFAMTINKSQGMTLRKVGVFLRRYLSDHGKLYVALSRVRRAQDIRMVLCPDDRQGRNPDTGAWFTHNAVRHHLWNLEEPPAPPRPEEQVPPPVQLFTGHDNCVVEPAVSDDGQDEEDDGEDDDGEDDDGEDEDYEMDDDEEDDDDDDNDDDNWRPPRPLTPLEEPFDAAQAELNLAAFMEELSQRDRESGRPPMCEEGTPRQRFQRRFFNEEVFNEFVFNGRGSQPGDMANLVDEDDDNWAHMPQEDLDEQCASAIVHVLRSPRIASNLNTQEREERQEEHLMEVYFEDIRRQNEHHLLSPRSPRISSNINTQDREERQAEHLAEVYFEDIRRQNEHHLRSPDVQPQTSLPTADWRSRFNIEDFLDDGADFSAFTKFDADNPASVSHFKKQAEQSWQVRHPNFHISERDLRDAGPSTAGTSNKRAAVVSITPGSDKPPPPKKTPARLRLEDGDDNNDDLASCFLNLQLQLPQIFNEALQHADARERAERSDHQGAFLPADSFQPEFLGLERSGRFVTQEPQLRTREEDPRQVHSQPPESDFLRVMGHWMQVDTSSEDDQME